MTVPAARIEIGLSEEMADLVRAGARNSGPDVARMKRIRELLRQADDIINELGIVEEDGELSKAMPIDQLASAVSTAVNKLNKTGYGEYASYDEWYHTAAVYPDVVIIRKGIGHWKASYTVGEKCVELPPRSEWVSVEISWVEKTDSEDESKEQQTGGEAIGKSDLRESAPVFADIKAVSEGRLRHYAVQWGDDQQRDLYREYFTAKTEELDAVFKAMGKLPLLYHHGMDDTLKATVVGVVDQMGVDEVGLWVESQLDKANKYRAGIERMVQAKKLGTSTGTLPGARKVSKSGEILRWAIMEVSLTPTPAEPGLVRDHPVELIKAAYQELGLPDPITHDIGAEKARQADTGAEEARQRELDLERERLALLSI